MAYHIEIAEERRTPTETHLGLDTSRLAHESDGVLYTSTSATLPQDFSKPQFVNVAEWDLKSPFVILHKGIYTPRFAGWPEITKEEFDALPADPVAA